MAAALTIDQLRKYLYLGAALAAAGTVGLAVSRSLGWGDQIQPLWLTMLMGGLLAMLYWPWVRLRARRRSSDYVVEGAYEITDDNILMRSGSQTSGIAWDGVDQVKATPEFWILYVGQMPATVIPRTEAARRHRHEIGQWAQRLLEQAPPEDRTPAEDRPRVVAGLIAAASRYHVRQEPAGFDTLVRQHCDPDDPVARHLRANVHDDYAAQIHTAPPALAELRRLGAEDLAAQIEVDLGVALIFQGQYARGEAQLTPLIDRFRSHGPPTLLHWTLMLLGFSAAFQGRRAAADQLFDQALDVPLPARTHSPNQSVRAQALFRRGDRRAAYQLLRAHVEELLDADNMHAACVVMVSFVTMMTAVARFADGAQILAFLDTTGTLDNAAWAAMVADARDKLATFAPIPNGSMILDQRQALATIGNTLDDLLVEQASPVRC